MHLRQELLCHCLGLGLDLLERDSQIADCCVGLFGKGFFQRMQFVDDVILLEVA